MTLPKVKIDATGSLVKFLCCSCGDIDRIHCRHEKDLEKFKNQKLNEGLCKNCNSDAVIFKNGKGQLFEV